MEEGIKEQRKKENGSRGNGKRAEKLMQGRRRKRKSGNKFNKRIEVEGRVAKGHV